MFAKDALRGAKRTNAVQPVCWLCVVVSVPCFIMASRIDGALSERLFLVGCAPIGLFILAIYFTCFGTETACTPMISRFAVAPWTLLRTRAEKFRSIQSTFLRLRIHALIANTLKASLQGESGDKI